MFFDILKKRFIWRPLLLFILLIILSEIALRSARIIATDGRIKIAEKISNDHVRILALGESTTDNSFLTKDNKAWPEHLEQMANQKKLKIKIFNRAKAATTTNEILANIDELLNHYKPQIVITMIGINDSHTWTVKINTSPLKNFRVYRVMTWFFWNFSTFFSYKPLPFKTFDTELLDLNMLDEKSKSQYYAYLNSKLVPYVPLPIDITNSDAKYKQSLELLKLSLQSDNFVQGVLGQYTWLLIKVGDYKECSRIIKKYIDIGGVLNYFELMNAQECLVSEQQSLDYLQRNQDNLSLMINPEAVLGNYKKIHNKIIASGAIHIILQYPNLSNDNLKNAFKENPSTYHVENLHNFKGMLKTHNYNELFLDNFATDFGHTTEFGHQLIAHEVLNFLPKIISTLK